MAKVHLLKEIDLYKALGVNAREIADQLKLVVKDIQTRAKDPDNMPLFGETMLDHVWNKSKYPINTKIAMTMLLGGFDWDMTLENMNEADVNSNN